MSVATLDDYSSHELKKESHEVNAERARILNMVSKKAKEQTLTLQETTDLYEKFNRTYSAYRSNEPQYVDESWALELLQECEQEEAINSQENISFQTRINGIPHQTKADSDKTKPEQVSPANDVILVDSVPVLDNEITFKPQNLNFKVNEHFESGYTEQRSDAFASFIIASSVVTIGILIGFSIFF